MLRPYPPSILIPEFVNICHKIAVAVVRLKISSQAFDPGRFGLTAEDFAYDSIADLFVQDQDGRFRPLVRYFGKIDCFPNWNNEEALGSLRRLIGYAVNQRIVMCYRESDPSLARLIRNIKMAVKSHATATMRELDGEKVIAPRGSLSLNEHLPEVAPELLEIDLRHRIAGHISVNKILTAIIEVLSEQADYRKMYSIVGAALLIRSITLSRINTGGDAQEEEFFSDDELFTLIDAAVKSVRESQGEKYVSHAKAEPDEVDSFCKTMRDILRFEFIGGNGVDKSYYEIMKSHRPEITELIYRSKYRHVIEYMTKLARESLVEVLRQEA